VDQAITRFFAELLDTWHQATLADYLHMALAVVLVGWYVRRMSPR
jgi:hypothetical protein